MVHNSEYNISFGRKLAQRFLSIIYVASFLRERRTKELLDITTNLSLCKRLVMAMKENGHNITAMKRSEVLAIIFRGQLNVRGL